MRRSSLDIARGLALILMVFYHVLFILNFFNVVSINVHSGVWRGFGILAGFLFVFIVGVSLYLSSLKKRGFEYYLKRGGFVIFLGFLITLFTYFFLDKGMVLFGVLHLIGVSIILGYFFLKLGRYNLLLGSLFTIIGLFLINKTVNFSYLLWLGLKPFSFYTLDYFPLLPWFGVVLLGIYFGKYIYEGRKVRTVKNKFLLFLSYLGRHTLLIYLIHIPLIVLVLVLIRLIPLSSLF